VTDTTETHYRRSADGTNLAYQVSGEGPLQVVWRGAVAGLPFDLLGDDPGFIRVRRRLGAFSRTVWFDARGMGASEGDPRDLLSEGVFDADLTAVLDTVGFDRPAMVAGAP
jgi:hypothetical protein